MPLFSRKKPNPIEQPPPINIVRSSQEVSSASSVLSNVGKLYKAYETLPFDMPFELYDYVELIAIYNPDYSQAVDNMVKLANPGFNIVVGETGKQRVRRLTKRLREKSEDVNRRDGGFNGIISGLIWQAAVYGAMCGEWVIKSDFSDVARFAFVNPKYIRFQWDEAEEDWHPYQQVSGSYSGGVNDLVKLNTQTFYYQSVFSVNNSPYGIPPFFSALENISIQRDMIESLKNIVRKMGLLGIIEMVITQMPKYPEETDVDYMNRMTKVLTSYQTVLNDMLASGGVAHFDDVDMKNLAVADRGFGADAIFKLNEEQVFSGLHSLPSVQGRSYSTTETYSGVSYDMILRNAKTFTNQVKYIMESGCRLMAILWGDYPATITVNFFENKTLQRLQNAQSEAVEYKTHRQQWADGIIEQEQVAQMHGYNEVAEEMDDPAPSPDTRPAPSYEPEPPGGGTSSENPPGGEGEGETNPTGEQEPEGEEEE